MSEISQEDRTMGLVAHLSGLVAIGPLIIWLMHKDNPDKKFVTDHALEALNFVVTMIGISIVMTVISTVFAFIPVLGWLVAMGIGLLMFVLGITALVFLIMAGLKANEGNTYRYPFAIRLIK